MKRHDPDRVALVHPLLPDVEINVHRRSVPAYKARGWVRRPKSPAAPVVEQPKTADAVRLSQGDPK